MHGHLSYALGYNLVLLYFVAQMISAPVMRVNWFGSCVPLAYSHTHVCFILFLNISLLSNTIGSSGILPVPDPVPFSGEWY